MSTLASMTGFRVSELAARAGVNASTVRFYERAGLLPGARRTANGYRVFDDSALGDLALIGRAKAIGMNLDEVTRLLAAWRGSGGGDCRVAHGLLREHLAAQVTRLNGQVDDLTLSRQRSEAALGRLSARQPGAEGCHTDCACLTAFGPATGDEGLRPTGCTPDNDELACRAGEWRALAAAAVPARRDGGFLRLTLEPAMVLAAAELIAAKAIRCSDARFTLEVTASQVILTADFPTGPANQAEPA